METKLKIIVAEGNTILRDNLKDFLAEHGFDVLSMSNGLEAVLFCQRCSDIDLILMGGTMDMMNGDEAARNIKKIHPKLPIISTRGKWMSDEEKAIFDACIRRPFDLTKLLSLVKKTLHV